MPLSLWVANRLYGSSDGRRVSRPAIRIATAGVAVGVAVMLIAVSIAIGFKQTIRDKAVGFCGAIQVANYMSQQTAEAYPITINDSLLNILNSIDGVEHTQRFAYTQGLLKTDDAFLGVTLKGVAQEWDSTFIHSNLCSGALPTFSAEGSSNKLVVSQSIANSLQLKVNDRLFAYFFDGEGIRTRRFTIAAIYETSLAQYDDVVAFTDLYTTTRLNGWSQGQALGAELSISNYDKLDAIADAVAARVDGTNDDEGNRYGAITIRELNPQIFAWLDLLDMNVWIILLLMALVAAVTMVAGLLIIILERTSMIGTLTALGARIATLQRTFLFFGLFIILRGLLIGDAVALALLALQRFCGIIRLDAQTYYVSEVPIAFDWRLFILINIATLVITLLVLLLPSLLVAHIKPAKTLRFE